MGRGLRCAGIRFARQVPIGLRYQDIQFEAGFRLDVLVKGLLDFEINTREQSLPLQTAQILTYTRFDGFRVDFVMKFTA